MAYRTIKIDGIKVNYSKKGNAKIWLKDFNVLDTLKEALQKKPDWKDNFGENEREFLITSGGIGEVWDDGADVPPNFDNTKKKEDETWEPTEDDDQAPF